MTLAPSDTDLFRRPLIEGLEAMGLTVSAHQIEQFMTYLSMLRKWNAIHNFTGFPVTEWVTRIILESATLTRLIPSDPAPKTGVDFGSGAGIPGMVLAILRSCDRFFLVESRMKRADFLAHVASACSLRQVRIVAKRVEALMRNQIDFSSDVIVARAFGSLQNIVQLGEPILTASGRFVLPRGKNIATEVSDFLSSAGSRWIASIQPLGIPGVVAEQSCVVIERRSDSETNP